MQTGTWQAGHYSTKRVPGTFTVHEAIHSNLVQSLKRFCRLYFIDGSVPGSLPCGYHSQAELPGELLLIANSGNSQTACLLLPGKGLCWCFLWSHVCLLPRSELKQTSIWQQTDNRGSRLKTDL